MQNASPAPQPQPPTQPPLTTPSHPLPAAAIAARKKAFPEALFDLVSYCHKTHHDVLRWASDGFGFVVLDRRSFEFNILPLFFRHGKFTSLERQLANYGFKRDGRGVGAYRHEGQLFHQDYPDKAKDIRLKNKGPAATTSTSTMTGKRNLAEAQAEVQNPCSLAAAGAPPLKHSKTADPAATASNPVAQAPGPPSLSMLAAAATLPEPGGPPVNGNDAAMKPLEMDDSKPSAAGLMQQPPVVAPKPPAVGSMNMTRAVISLSGTRSLDDVSVLARAKSNKNRKPAILPMTVPNLSLQQLPRAPLVESIVSQLLQPDSLSSSTWTRSNHASHAVCVHGMAGVGKTWAVSLAIRNRSLRCHFDEGIAWIALSETSKVHSVRQLVHLYKLVVSQVQLTDPACVMPHFSEEDEEDMELAHAEMSAFMVHRRVLLVLDNLYHAQDLRWFNFGRCEEENCPYRLVVTTRLRALPRSDGSILWDDMFKIAVPPLEEKEALDLFLRESGRFVLAATGTDQEHARAIVRTCGNLPLLVKRAAQMASTEQPHSWGLSDLSTNLYHIFKTDTSRNNVWSHLDKTFQCVDDVSTRTALMRLFQTLARAMASGGYMSFEVVKRYMEGSQDASSSSSSSKESGGSGWNALQVGQLQSLSGALWGDKVAVVLSALTTMGCLSVRTTERMGHAKSFEYRLANPVWGPHAEQWVL